MKTALIPESKYPVTVIGLRADNRAEIYRKVVEKPTALSLVEIPPLSRINKCPIIIRIEWGDGTSEEAQPPTNAHTEPV